MLTKNRKQNMSRQTHIHNKHVTVYHGSDHALGAFVDIVDDRFAGHEKDEQGEGFLLEYCTKLGFISNLIGATVEDLQSNNGEIDRKIEEFISSLTK